MTTLNSPELDASPSDSSGQEHAHGDHRMFGVATFLVADAMTFAGFFAAYLTFHAVNPLQPDAVYELELPLPILNTVLLLVSSATFHRAGKRLHQGDPQACRRWLLATAAMGLAFLVSQMVEYFTLPFGLTSTRPSPNTAAGGGQCVALRLHKGFIEALLQHTTTGADITTSPSDFILASIAESACFVEEFLANQHLIRNRELNSDNFHKTWQ